MKNKGFTLLELLLTVAMIGVLISFAIPALHSTVQNNRLLSCSNKLVTAVQYAKSEAVTQKQTVLVTSQANANGTPNYRVGFDNDSDNAVSAAELLQVISCEGEGITMSNSLGTDYISFGATGFRNDGQGTITFTTCNEKKLGKVFNVSIGGAVSSDDAPSGSC